MPVNFDEYVVETPKKTIDFDSYQSSSKISFDDYQVDEVSKGLELAYPSNLEAIAPEIQVEQPPGTLDQVLNIPKVFRTVGAETGLTTAGGVEASRAKALREQSQSPVGLEGRLITQSGVPRTAEERLANAIDRANVLSSERADRSAQEFLDAASNAPEEYGLDPRLETGLITQATRGLAKGAGMYAVAVSGGIPALAVQGSSEAFGAAKQAGKSDDEADKEATRALIGLALFAGANKAVASGIAKYLGNTSKLRTFLVQTLGQAAGNEATSRAISAYEAALDAPEGKRADAAVEAISKNDAATIAQNLGFALMGGMQSTRNMVVRQRNELQLESVARENAQRAETEAQRTERIIAEQNAEAARLGEQRKAQGAEFVQPEAAALSPEQRARASAAPPIITGETAPSAPQQGRAAIPETPEVLAAPAPRQDEVQVDIESGTVKTPDGRTVTVDETGVTEVVPGSPKDISTKVLVPEKPATKEAEPVTEVPEAVTTPPEAVTEVQTEAVGTTPVEAEAPPGPPPPVTPVENRGRPPLPEQTGLRNAIVDQNRVAQGLPPRMEILRKTFGNEWVRAMEMVEQNPNSGSILVSEIAKTPRALTPTENALFLHEQVTRENNYNQALREVNEATTEADRVAAEARLTFARDQNQEIYDAGQNAGTAAGQDLAFRKMLVNRDYSLASIETELTALKQPKTPQEAKAVQAEAAELHSRIKQAEERARVAEEKLAQAQGHEEWLKLQKIARSESSAARKEGKSILDRIISTGEQAQKRIRERNLKAMREGVRMQLLPFNILDFPDHVLVGAGYIAKGVKTLADFTKRFTDDFGPEAEPHAPRVFEAASKYHEEAVSRVPKIETVQQAAAKDVEGNLNPQVVYDIARAHVNAGTQGFEPTMQATLATLKSKHPDLTMREVRDVFSGYGKVTRPSQAADRVKLREYRRIAQLTSAIEDAQKKIAPMKSGPQRDKATEDVRVKMAELKRVMEENGIQVTSPEQQLANAERSATTRLQNTIESLERQIATKTRDLPASRKGVDTPEIRKLKQRVDDLRKTLDEVSPAPDLTDAQKIQRSIDAVQKRIAQLDEQLKTGLAPERRPNTPTSPSLERLRAERDAMSKLSRDLQRDPGKPIEQRKIEQALKSVDKQIAELDRQLQTGDIQPKPNQPSVTSPQLEAKRAERDSMRQLRTELRNLSRPKLTADQRAIKAAQKAIQELDAQIKSGNLSPKNVPRGTVSPELEALRSERDAMRRFILEKRNEAKTKRSPEEIALDRYKKSLATRTKEIQDRIAKNDYVKRPRKETALDKEALDAKFEYQKAKDAFEQKAFEYDLSRRGAAKKAYDTALEVLNTSRSIMTSFDVSAPLRQGAFITLAHPIRSAKNLPNMFRAAGLSPGAAMEGIREFLKTGNPLKYFKAAGEYGDRMSYALQESLSNPLIRPNASLYRSSGLDLTDVGTNVTRRKMEEIYQSRFARKIPIVGGSQRAYTTFLNQLRADSFDAMVKNLAKGGKVTDQEAKAIASFINGATGRVKFPGQLEQSTQVLNSVFFAPKYVASRLKLIVDPLTGFSISSGLQGSARVRLAMAKEYARFLTGAAIVLGLARLGGAEIEEDPRSSDFLSIKIGNTRLDILGGLKQIVTLGAREATGKTKTLSTGRIEKVDRVKALDTFMEYKLAPIFSTGRSLLSGKDPVGQPITKTGAALQLVTPLPFGDIIDAMVEQGIPRGTAISIVSLFGASMSTFDARRREKVARQPWEEVARDFRKISEKPIEGRRGF